MAPRAHGPIDEPRLTEPAAADAPAEQLQHHPVVDDLGGGDHGLGGVIRLVHVLDDPLGDHGGDALLRRDGRDGAVLVIGHVIQGGDVQAGDLRGGAEHPVLGPALALGPAVQLDQLHGDVLALAEGDDVHEGGQRLGIVGAGPADDDERGERRPVRAVDGQARQVEQVQHVGVGQLIAEGDADQVELRDRVAALQGVEGQTGLAHLVGHVAPGGEHALAPDSGDLVHHAVEDADAQVGHADLIGVREAEGIAAVHLGLVLVHRAVFAAHVAPRLLYAGEQLFQLMIHGGPPVSYERS